MTDVSLMTMTWIAKGPTLPAPPTTPTASTLSPRRIGVACGRVAATSKP